MGTLNTEYTTVKILGTAVSVTLSVTVSHVVSMFTSLTGGYFLLHSDDNDLKSPWRFSMSFLTMAGFVWGALAIVFCCQIHTKIVSIGLHAVHARTLNQPKHSAPTTTWHNVCEWAISFPDFLFALQPPSRGKYWNGMFWLSVKYFSKFWLSLLEHYVSRFDGLLLL